MGKETYVVGPDLDREKLGEYGRLLKLAYDNGEARGGSMDWNDVQAALAAGIEALGGEARQFMADAEAGEVEPDAVSVEFAEGTDLTAEAFSAARLLVAYQTPDDVRWEDVDAAWESLVADDTAAPTP